MSTSLLYHAFGVRGCQEVALDFVAPAVRFRLEQDESSLRCSNCSSSHVNKSGVVIRQFRTVPIGRKEVFLELPCQRLYCFDCNKTRQARIPFADPRFGYTRSFERYALDLSRRTTIAHAAAHLNVGWDTVKEIQKRTSTGGSRRSGSSTSGIWRSMRSASAADITT